MAWKVVRKEKTNWTVFEVEECEAGDQDAFDTKAEAQAQMMRLTMQAAGVTVN